MPRASQPAHLARLLAALADPTRLRLLNLMAGNDMGHHEVCVCFFVEILHLSQPKISRHLAYLRRAGLVRSRRQGKWMHYSIQPPTGPAAAATFTAVLHALSHDWQMQLDLSRLTRACCQPQKFITLKAAPRPATT